MANLEFLVQLLKTLLNAKLGAEQNKYNNEKDDDLSWTQIHNVNSLANI